MVQTIRTVSIAPGQKKIIVKKPKVLCRIFFSIQAFADLNAWYQSKISFDDPNFTSFFSLNGPAKYFEAKGENIFQGNVWVLNASTVVLQYSATEILR